MKKALIWTLSGAAAVGLVGTGVAGWALLQPVAESSTTTSPEVDQDEPGAGIVVDQAEVPALYTGDELTWFIPADDVLTGLVGAQTFDDIQAAYGSAGEREGITARTAECDPLVWEDFTGVIGQRYRSFSTTDAEGGSVRVMQFASAEAATAWVAPRLDIPESCATFDWGYFYEDSDEVLGHFSYSVLSESSEGDARVVVDRLDIAETGPYDLDRYQGVMVNGNTVTVLNVNFRDQIEIDADAVADALLAQAGYAHEQLTSGVR